MNLATRFRRSVSRSGANPWPTLTLDQLPAWFGQFGYQGLSYGPTLTSTIQNNRETIAADFTGYVQGAYKTNGAVFACILTRLLLFSEATFIWRRQNSGRPGQLFGTNELLPLETPWQNGTTGDLLTRMETDVSLAGNFYGVRIPDRNTPSGRKIARLRPDWVTILLGTPDDKTLSGFDPTAEKVGYVYTPGGPGSGLAPKLYTPDQVCHYAPIPDPLAHYRGMSWLEPVMTEVLGDRLMNTHKIAYFENGASPNLVVSMDTGRMDRKTFKEWVETFQNDHEGAINAYKTLYLGQGASATIVGSNLKDLDYAVNQGHGETRLAAAAGIPPIIVGFSEGLQSATYSNFAQARRAFADKTLRPLWRNAAGSLATLVDVPGGAELWYDDRDIPFLQADAADGADVQLTKATAVRLLVDSGYEPDSVVQAIEADDFSLLKHSGLYSVQLQAPSTSLTPAIGEGWKPDSNQPALPNGNGNGNNGNGSAAPSGAAKTAPTGANGNTPGQIGTGRALPAAKRRATIIQNIDSPQQLAQALKAAKAGDER